MSMFRKTITIPDAMENWVKTQIDAGRYASDSEYFRDLIRRDQERQLAQDHLRRLIDEGLASGKTEKTLAEIWAEAEGRHARANG